MPGGQSNLDNLMSSLKEELHDLLSWESAKVVGATSFDSDGSDNGRNSQSTRNNDSRNPTSMKRALGGFSSLACCAVDIDDDGKSSLSMEIRDSNDTVGDDEDDLDDDDDYAYDDLDGDDEEDYYSSEDEYERGRDFIRNLSTVAEDDEDALTDGSSLIRSRRSDKYRSIIRSPLSLIADPPDSPAYTVQTDGKTTEGTTTSPTSWTSGDTASPTSTPVLFVNNESDQVLLSPASNPSPYRRDAPQTGSGESDSVKSQTRFVDDNSKQVLETIAEDNKLDLSTSLSKEGVKIMESLSTRSGKRSEADIKSLKSDGSTELKAQKSAESQSSRKSTSTSKSKGSLQIATKGDSGTKDSVSNHKEDESYNGSIVDDILSSIGPNATSHDSVFSSFGSVASGSKEELLKLGGVLPATGKLGKGNVESEEKEDGATKVDGTEQGDAGKKQDAFDQGDANQKEEGTTALVEDAIGVSSTKCNSKEESNTLVQAPSETRQEKTEGDLEANKTDSEEHVDTQVVDKENINDCSSRENVLTDEKSAESIGEKLEICLPNSEWENSTIGSVKSSVDKLIASKLTEKPYPSENLSPGAVVMSGSSSVKEEASVRSRKSSKAGSIKSGKGNAPKGGDSVKSVKASTGGASVKSGKASKGGGSVSKSRKKKASKRGASVKPVKEEASKEEASAKDEDSVGEPAIKKGASGTDGSASEGHRSVSSVDISLILAPASIPEVQKDPRDGENKTTHETTSAVGSLKKKLLSHLFRRRRKKRDEFAEEQ